MGFMHIENLYREEAQRILEFRRLYVSEKIHGTSANVTFRDGHVTYSSGGASAVTFKGLFDQALLEEAFKRTLDGLTVGVYGEAYGGSQQKMAATYGPSLYFTAFDVQINGLWLSVPQAEEAVQALGLEFVPYVLLEEDTRAAMLAALDVERDRASIIAIRRGVGPGKIREGVVARPPFEVTLNDGKRLIAKHKRAEFMERANQPKVDAPKPQALVDASAIADEWVTRERLTHVLDHALAAGAPLTSKADIKRLIPLMVEDIYREGKGEIVETKATEAAIGRRAATLFLERLGG